MFHFIQIIYCIQIHQDIEKFKFIPKVFPLFFYDIFIKNRQNCF